jgi:hypothetical protein
MKVLGTSFSPWSGFFFRQARRKSKDWLARNQDNVFEWGDICLSAENSTDNCVYH